MSFTQIERMGIIGGSDISAIMGMSHWKTPLSLWAEKTGKVQDELGNFEAAEIGAELEEFVARKFSRKTGKKLRRDSRTFKHPKYEYMVAHIDRWIVGEDALFEAKTCSAYKLKEWDGEKIPDEYLLQVQWYMGIVKKKKAFISVLIGGQKFLWKEVEFDQELFEKMVESAKDFKENFLDTGIMPVAVAGDNDFLDTLWPQSMPEKVLSFQGEKEEQMNMLIEERVGGILVIKDAKKDLDDIEAKIKQELGEHEMGTTGQYVFSWKTQERRSADTKKLKEDGIFEKYEKVSSFRVLRTKKVAGQLELKQGRKS